MLLPDWAVSGLILASGAKEAPPQGKLKVKSVNVYTHARQTLYIQVASVNQNGSFLEVKII